MRLCCVGAFVRRAGRSFRRTALSNSSRKLSFRASQFPVVRPMGPQDVRTLCSQLTVQTSFVCVHAPSSWQGVSSCVLRLCGSSFHMQLLLTLQHSVVCMCKRLESLCRVHEFVQHTLRILPSPTHMQLLLLHPCLFVSGWMRSTGPLSRSLRRCLLPAVVSTLHVCVVVHPCIHSRGAPVGTASDGFAFRSPTAPDSGDASACHLTPSRRDRRAGWHQEEVRLQVGALLRPRLIRAGPGLRDAGTNSCE